MSSARSLILSLTADASNYTKNMKLAAAETANSKKELALWAAENKKSETSLAYMGKALLMNKEQQAILGKQIDITKNKLQEQSAKFGETSSQATTYKNKLLDLETAQTKLNNSIKNAPKQMLNTIGSNMMGAGKSMTMGMTAPIIGGAMAVGAGFMGAVNNADRIQQKADVTGLSAERLQALEYAGKKLDVEMETITGSQSKLIKAMYAGRDASSEQGKAFASLHINVKDANGQLRNSNDVMMETFDALGRVGNETNRDALALKIFGKSAMELNPLIKAGSQELKNLTAEAMANGAVLSDAKINALDKFGDSLDAMKYSLMGTAGEMATQLLPTFQAMLDEFKRGIPYIKSTLDFFVNMNPAIRNMGLGTIAFLAVAGPLVMTLGSLVKVSALVYGGLVTLPAILGTVTSAFALCAGGAATFGEAALLVMGPAGWIALGIGVLATAVIGMNMYSAAQSAATKKSIELSNATVGEISNATVLMNSYNELKNKTNLTAQEKANLFTVTDQLRQLSPQMATALDGEQSSVNNLTNAYGDLIKQKGKLVEKSAIEAKNNYGSTYNQLYYLNKEIEDLRNPSVTTRTNYKMMGYSSTGQALTEKLEKAQALEDTLKGFDQSLSNWTEYQKGNFITAKDKKTGNGYVPFIPDGAGLGNLGGVGGDKNKKAVDQLANAFDSYKTKIDSAIESTLKFVGTFDKFDTKSQSLGSMMRNMQNNLKTMAEYKTNMEKLKERGYNAELIDDLYKQGVGASGIVKKLANASWADEATINATDISQRQLANQLGYMRLGGKDGVKQTVVNINGKTFNDNDLLNKIFELLAGRGIVLDG